MGVHQNFQRRGDIGLFNKIAASVDYYQRRSEDLLQKVAPGRYQRFPYAMARMWPPCRTRLGDADQFERQYQPGIIFRWNTSFNISFNKNKIISVANDSLRQRLP